MGVTLQSDWLLIGPQVHLLDHHRAVSVATRKPPPDWRRPVGRPRHTWLRAMESDLRPLNIGLSAAWRKAANRDAWRSVVDMAMIKMSLPWKKKQTVYMAIWKIYSAGSHLQQNRFQISQKFINPKNLVQIHLKLWLLQNTSNQLSTHKLQWEHM